ncbi:MAG: ParB N-terminal domain-containing protein [Muribaculaceae bacterium]|nr:ParB N-terminal domain-containing protein [Muribaculaceae bacterium]
MEIIYKRVEELVEYEGNARRNDAGVAKVAESIKEFGFLQPITITPDNVIISGHTRLKAAKQLGLEEVPCVVHNLSEEDANLARIVDNKSHEYSTWDVGKLHKELNGINMDFKSTFFTPNRDRKFFTENKFLIFGNNELPITEDEYARLKAVYDEYIAKNKTYLGFVMFLTGGSEE